MTEPPPRIEEENGAAPTARALFSRAMALLILPASCVGAAASAIAFLAQTSGLSDPGKLTALVAAITLIEAAGSAAATRLPATAAPTQVILAALGALVLVAGLSFAPAFLFAVFALSFLVGLALPLRAAAVQRLASDDVRAQAASMASACDMALSTIVLPAAGAWRDRS